MKDGYIRKEEVSEWLKQYGQDVIHGKYKLSLIFIWKKLMDLPSADVAPVVHGKWMKEDRGHVEYCAVCDQCGFDWMWSDRGYFKFCPNCGAKMDGERKE